MKLKRILVANRGEIARRVFRTIKELGMDAIAMHSEADRNSLFVKEADESFLLPNGYLDQDTIINKAKELKVDAIHPGYGFLSENAEFCKKVKDEKIVWIGPDAETISLMGDKINSKNFCTKENIPTLQKTSKVSDAKKIGFPILVKASAGGGGKGMRIVKTEKELKDAVIAAKRDATETGVYVTDLVMRLVGGIGLEKENEFERLFRDARSGLINPPIEARALESIANSALTNKDQNFLL